MAGPVSIKEFNANVNKFLQALPANAQRINKVIALTQIPIIKNRIIDKGVLGDGKSLGKYSEEPISTGFFVGKFLGKGAEDKAISYIKKKRKETGKFSIGISYKQFREFNNRPTDHVTLSFTGETLGDIGVISNDVNGTVATAVVGSKNSKTKEVVNSKGKKTGTIGTGDVLDQLGEKYGDILSLTPQEEKAIERAFEVEVQAFIDRYL